MGSMYEQPSSLVQQPNAEWRRVAAYVLCRDHDGRILLTRFKLEGHPDSGKWTMPGGGMEWGEEPAETATRELEEETGLRADIGRVAGVFSRWYGATEAYIGAPGHVIGIVFDGMNVRGNLRTEFVGDPDDTTDAAAWFTLEEARALPHVELLAYCLELCGSADNMA
jgi:8-oxo-dGTP pyrophosphatase MutT (NUDIX family)